MDTIAAKTEGLILVNVGTAFASDVPLVGFILTEELTMTPAGANAPVPTEKAEGTSSSSAVRREARPLPTLQRAVDRLFEDFDRDWLPALRRRWFGGEPLRDGDLLAVPAADITEDDKGYELSMELPGLDENSIDVKVSDHMLTISGEKKEEKEEKRKDYFLSERRYGSFRRSFGIPPGVDTDKIAADFAKGVLKVTLPKTPAARQAAKKIAVRPG